MSRNKKTLPRESYPSAKTLKTLSFGSITVRLPQVSETELKRNIAAGQKAMKRASGRLIKSGITLPAAKGVPMFQADADDPDIIIRILDGKKQSGRFIGNKFKASE
jgi:hypothetical protein